MHIILGLKKHCLGPANIGAALTGEAPSVSAAKKPNAKKMREAEKQAKGEQDREQELANATAKKRFFVELLAKRRGNRGLPLDLPSKPRCLTLRGSDHN